MKNKNILEKVYLKGYNDFVKIDNIHYGGYQGWLSKEGHISKFWSNRACGLISATNIFYYMGAYHKGSISPKKINISKENFIDFALYLYKFIKPRIYGIPTIPIMIKGMNNYAKTMGIELTPFLLINPLTKSETIEYIKDGLRKNYPIMMLTWNTNQRNLKYHWVTITGYYKDIEEKNYILTSNWAKKENFSLDEWFDDKSLYKGLVYFTVSNNHS